MKQKSKKFLSILLTLCMVLSLLSGMTVTASAASGSLYVNGVDVTTATQDQMPQGVAYDEDTSTLTLTNATLDTYSTEQTVNGFRTVAVIYVSGIENLTIDLVGENTITYKSDNSANAMGGIVCKDASITVQGSGSLNLKNEADAGNKVYYGMYGFYPSYATASTSIGSLTIKDDATVTCDAGGNTEKVSGTVYGIRVGGTLTVQDNGKLLINTKDGRQAYGIELTNSSGANNTLTGNAKVVSMAGNSGSSNESFGIKMCAYSTLEIGANASLRIGGNTGAMYNNNQEKIKQASGAKLIAMGSEEYVGENGDLPTTIVADMSYSDLHAGSAVGYKTIEIAKKAQYATAAWSLKGYRNGRDISNAEIRETTTKEGISNAVLEGFSTTQNGAFDKTGTFNNANTYFVKISLTKDDAYTFKTNAQGIPTGITLNGKTAVEYNTDENYLIFELEAPQDVNTVRTITLDLESTSNITDTNGEKITANNSVYACEDEGWSWNADTKTLTLDNCTIDVTGEGDGIKFTDDDINLILKGTNSVTAGTSSRSVYAIYQPSDNHIYRFTISEEGTGTLTAATKSTCNVMRTDRLILNSGTVTLVNNDNKSGYGLETGLNLEVNGGTFSAVGFNQGAIACYGKVIVNGGHLTASGGEYALMTSGRPIPSSSLEISSSSSKKPRIKAGDSADNAKKTTDKETYRQAKYIDIDFDATPEPAVFTDGFGGTVESSALGNYTKGTTTHGEYIFAGWFDESGNELKDTDKAEGDTTYTARWKAANGKFVRTAALDFSNSNDTSWKTGCTQSGTTWTNTNEGWTWDSNQNLLTLSGVTIDVPENAGAEAAIKLPRSSGITTTKGTTNIVRNSGVSTAGSEQNGNGILAIGSLEVDGDGEITISGKTAGLYAQGNLYIDAALTATAETGGVAVLSDYRVNLYSRWSVKTPDGGTVVNTPLSCIADSEGNPAVNVVIGLAPAVFTDGFGNTIDKTTAESYTKGTTTNGKGYSFAGWYDGKGIELRDFSNAQNGATYTAKWTNNGKTVRTMALTLTNQSTDISSSDEGWSWDANTNTLTIEGVTIDVLENQAAIALPDGATINTKEDTNNIVLNDYADGISGDGALTIKGNGNLSVTGEEHGVYANGKLAINAPLVSRATDTNGKAVLAATITKEDCWSIKTPDRGKIISDGSTAYIGNGKVANEVIIGAAELYTIKYDTNGGSKIDDVSAYEDTNLVKPADNPTKNGYNFIGWYKDEGLKTLWDFESDIVTSNITLYAKWTKEPVHDISGVIEKDNSPVEGAKVILKQGKEEISIATTDQNGEYTFDNVPAGEYNIVIERTEGDDVITTTVLVTVSEPEEGQTGTIKAIALSNKAVSSIVEVEEGTPAVLVGGLDDEALNQAGSTGNDVTVKLTVESQDKDSVATAAAAEIEKLAGKKTLEYLDMAVNKIIGSDITAINNTNNVLEIVVPFKTSGRKGITVYRHHEGENAEAETKVFEKLDKRPTDTNAYEDGTYFVGDGFVVIYTQKFSTYAIGYTTYSGGGNSVQKPEITTSNGGKTELSANGTTATITPDAGYEIESVILNGNDMGKVNQVTGLKTGDKLVVTFRKTSEETVDMDKQIKQQLSKTWLMARSSYTAKKNVKLTFKTDEDTKALLKEIQKAGYTVKYTYFRSVKKSAIKNEASYKKMCTKASRNYWNTYGTKGQMYYYRVSILVCDKDGKQVAKTNLKQCKYANRLWTKK